MGKTFHSNRDETEQHQLQGWVLVPPQPVGLTLQLMRVMVCIIPLVLQERGLAPSSSVMDIVVGSAECHVTHRLKQNKRSALESKKGKDF